MKSYRNAAAALVLALVLTASAFAGEIHTDRPAPPPQPATNSVVQTGATDGEIQTGIEPSTPEAADSITETTLNLLQSLFSLF